MATITYFPTAGGGAGTVTSVVAGQNVAVDASTAAAPIVAIGPQRGAALTDADQTLQPFTDQVSEYALTTTLTASRTKTAGVTSATAGTVLYFRRRDRGAFTMLVVNGGTNGGTIWTFSATPPTSTDTQPLLAIQYNGADWLFAGFWYAKATT